MTNMHGSTGDLVLLGTRTENLEPLFYDLTHELNWDLGGSGSNLRTPACCLGKARCEWACYRHPGCLPRSDHALPGRDPSSRLPL